MPTHDPVFALIDCNSFYASCERVFRPDLAKTPIVVLSNNDLRGGSVSSSCTAPVTRDVPGAPISDPTKTHAR
ncbi:hypothetical protein [Pseudomonas sp. dw_358]|uniref:Y-family DNA polymerase n=1 Tax=Pseudomonas sp. dw_358 TaxID=2720083 RepID=UPI0021163914|nr:hypothetical protein [Pseudomonas sp. dw_358]